MIIIIIIIDGFYWFSSDTSPKFSSGPLISPSELDRLSNLHSLALDFSDFTSELCGLLASTCRTPLHRLSLLLNGNALEFKPLEGTATEDDWKALVRQHLFFDCQSTDSASGSCCI